jgi:DNA-binding HxlR family transcriptional regulator
MTATSSTGLLPADTPAVVRDIAHRGLIRLITEIDDNGPIQRRQLALTLPDLSRHDIRHALAHSHSHQLLATGTRHRLTDRGHDLATLYDAIARWARAHHYPRTQADFTTRVHTTLTLLPHHHSEEDTTAQALLEPAALAVLNRLSERIHAWANETAPAQAPRG